MSRGNAREEREPLETLERLARAELPDGLSPAATEEGWQRLAPRLQAPPRRAWWLLGPSLAAAAAAALLLVGPGPAAIEFTVEGNTHGGPTFIVADEARPAEVRFSDGSRAVFAPGARGRVLATDERGARLGLEQGRTRLQITRRARARWLLEAGPFTVEVTGTAFDVEWSAAAGVLEVSLHSGGVIVRSPFSQSVLVAGQRLRANVRERDVRITGPHASREALAPRPPGAAPPPPLSGAAASPAEPAASPPQETRSGPAPGGRPERRRVATATPGDWAGRLRAGDYAGVLSDAEARGLDRVLARAGQHELAALADAALFARRPDIARRAWIGLRARFPGSFEAGQAAFRLGRLSEDRDGDPVAAIGWYDRYLMEAPQGPFADEALGRKMIAVQRAHGPDRARAMAAEYLRRFPRGTYAEAARALAAPR